MSTRLGLLCVVKEEGKYLREFFSFYKLQGVEVVVVMNHGGGEVGEILEEVRAVGLVGSVLPWCKPAGSNCQLKAYGVGMGEFKTVWGFNDEFVVVADVDEFVYSPGGKTVKQVLDYHYNDASQVLVNWLCFGWRDELKEVIDRSPPGVLVYNIRRTKDTDDINRHVKGIVKVGSFSHFPNPHYAVVGGKTVDGRDNLIPKPSPFHEFWTTQSPEQPLLVMNHYGVKSRQHREEKVSKGRIDHTKPQLPEYLDKFDGVIYDDRILQVLLQQKNKTTDPVDLACFTNLGM